MWRSNSFENTLILGKTEGRRRRRWHHPYGRKQRGTKSLLMKVKEGSEKADLKLSIWKMKVMTWTSNQSILREIGPEYSLEGLMLKLKLQYFGHLMWRANLLEKTLMLGKIEGRKWREQQRMRWLDGITDSMGRSFIKLWETVEDRRVWGTAVHGVAKN